MERLKNALNLFARRFLECLRAFFYTFSADSIAGWLEERAERLKDWRDYRDGKFSRAELNRFDDLSRYRKDQCPQIVKDLHLLQSKYLKKYGKAANRATLPDNRFDEWCTACESFSCPITEEIFGMHVVFGDVEAPFVSFDKIHSFGGPTHE